MKRPAHFGITISILDHTLPAWEKALRKLVTSGVKNS